MLNIKLKMEFKISQQGAVSLYLALMTMIILLAIGLGITTIIISQMRMIRGMGDSVVAFHAADTGIEKTIFYDRKVTPEGARGLCDICNSCPITDCKDCNTNGADCDPLSCTDCFISYYSDFDGKRYDIEGVVSGGVTTIKSVGKYKETKRAIEVTK